MRERQMTLAEAARTLPGRPSLSTLHRWRTRGLRGVRLRTSKCGGRRVVSAADLEAFFAEVTLRVDGRRYTRREALQRFSERTMAVGESEPPLAQTSNRREQEIATAERRLKRRVGRHCGNAKGAARDRNPTEHASAQGGADVK